MSSNTSILDDQTTARSIDTEYFTASSHSSSTDYNTSNDIKGITIVWNSKILPYDGSGEMIKEKCTSCEQNIDDSIEEVVNYSDDLSLTWIISYITSTKEDVLFNSDTLSRIVSFLPSVDIQRLAQTCRRLGVREEGELSLILHDEALFKQPPPKGDCPICFIRMPTLGTGSRYMSCCGEEMCNGCYYAYHYDNQGNIVVDNLKCPFCRAPCPSSNEEIIKRIRKRVEAGDAVAVHKLGSYYSEGTDRYPQDYTKALELWHRAAELGNAEAYGSIGYCYESGEGVDVDIKKARYNYELAAMKGCTAARNNLGCMEERAGNKERAVRHYMIAVRGGSSHSLNTVKGFYLHGYVKKDEHAKASRSYQEYLDEIKSDQRDQAAAVNDKYPYY